MAEDGVAREVDGTGHVLVHPGQGRRVRVGLGGEVGRVQYPVVRRGGRLPRPARVVDDVGDVQGLRLRDHVVQGGVEDGRVHRAVDVRVLGRVVRGTVHVELLAGPDALLGGQ